MNIRQRLKFEKETFFLKYIFLKPLDWLGATLYNVVSDPRILLGVESLVFIGYLFRTAVIDFFNKYTIIFDRWNINILILMFLTSMYYIYKTQMFQDEYREHKRKQIGEVSGEDDENGE